MPCSGIYTLAVFTFSWGTLTFTRRDITTPPRLCLRRQLNLWNICLKSEGRREDTGSREVSGPEEVVTGEILSMLSIGTRRERTCRLCSEYTPRRPHEERASPLNHILKEWEGMDSEISRSGRVIPSGQQNQLRPKGRHS
ncbi:hypothetical protein AUEXF2481DRAFT_416493 [Aureobasidium subglaciale EXF-2481]|uniref:Uncharacterized protein n=1 Tax=Aureobasidium subglaciale (strain EXF-2481) TaxID=1043005 RepID=A0A074Y4U9_AURSE|nr:uncharacterized protein AUEXF2481DRAFT_416493 [Aureobasidium subglaciale EXF-2481]KEQ92735.1 hypothetical protein AUEXF2481DRAFT_416493 [Aureobasidium subglaciale EXF-2481]